MLLSKQIIKYLTCYWANKL